MREPQPPDAAAGTEAASSERVSAAGGTDAVAGGDDVDSANLCLASIEVTNFKAIARLSLELDPDVTYLVGENNCGKTSLLLALYAALGRARPTTDDLHRHADGSLASSAVVTVSIVPRSGDRFSDRARGLLQGNVHIPRGESRETAWIQTTFAPSREGGQLVSDRRFLQPGRAGLVPSSASFGSNVLSLMQCEFIDAARDLVADLGNRNSRWGRLLYDLQIPEQPDGADGPDPLSRSQLEAGLSAIAEGVKSASPVLRDLEVELTKLAEVQNTVGQVSLQPFPPRLEEIMRSVDILLRAEGPGAVSLPLRFQGMGSRSIAALFVFSALCAVRSGADQGFRPALLTLVEEPEAHLHPHAAVALRDQLIHLPGQKIVTSHSPHLIENASPSSLRVFRRRANDIEIRLLNIETLAGTAKFRRFVGRPFGEFFFSRLVIFGDGAAERDALPVLLGAALGRPPASMGITIVDSESLGNPQVPKLIEAAEQLGLPWLIFGDNDPAGMEALGKIKDPQSGSGLTDTNPRVVVAGAKAIEKLLIDAGYGEEIDDVAEAHGYDTQQLPRRRLAFLKDNKGWVTSVVAELAMTRAKAVPASVAELANRALSRLSLQTEGGVDDPVDLDAAAN